MILLKNKTIVLGIILCLTPTASAVDPGWDDARWDKFLIALRQTETGGQPREGLGCIGDSGEAYGPLQIHAGCLKDSKVNTTLGDCLNSLDVSRRVAKEYLIRYLPASADERVACRVWNGGPKGYKKSVTLGYLARFLRFWF